MSRLSNSPLELALMPDALRLRVRSGWRRPVLRAEVEAAWAPGQPLAPVLEGLLAQARTAAAGAAVAGFDRRTLDAEIANPLAHFDVVAGDFAGQPDAALTGIAGACVQELLGARHGRELRWQLQADERHLLVCAIDGGLLGALRSAAAAMGLRLRRIETSFGIDWNRHGRRLARGAGVFVSRGADEATSAFVRDGIVQALGACLQPDVPEDPGAPAPGVDALCNSIGLHAMAAPTRLDAQVGRMVAGLGLALDDVQRFVAVTDRGAQDAMSSRWEVCIEREAAA